MYHHSREFHSSICIHHNHNLPSQKPTNVGLLVRPSPTLSVLPVVGCWFRQVVHSTFWSERENNHSYHTKAIIIHPTNHCRSGRLTDIWSEPSTQLADMHICCFCRFLAWLWLRLCLWCVVDTHKYYWGNQVATNITTTNNGDELLSTKQAASSDYGQTTIGRTSIVLVCIPHICDVSAFCVVFLYGRVAFLLRVSLKRFTRGTCRSIVSRLLQAKR